MIDRLIQYLKSSFRRKMARRVTREYKTRTDRFELPGIGNVSFANWENPLVKPRSISKGNVDFFRRFLNEGDMAVDIGANTGIITTYMALACGKQGKVLAFDPNPYVFRVLSENATLNTALATIDAYNVAITDQEGEYYYNSSEASFNNGGISSQPENRHGKYSLSQKIKGVRLEDFLEEKYAGQLTRIKLLKTDAEGYDKEILRSVSALLHRIKPVVIAECFGKLTQAERFELYDILASLGYTLYYFSDFDAAAEVVRLQSREDMLRWHHFDFYATMG